MAITDEWPAAELATTTGLGHRRTVRDPDVGRATAFMDQQLADHPPAPTPA